MNLSEREKEELKAMIDRGEPLPPRYRSVLFAQPHEVELIWPGKTQEVTNTVLPFQSIEQIDEPRAGTPAGNADLFDFDRQTGRQIGGWTNKLIWGDNKLVLAALKKGPLRREIEAAGGLKLVYIDPPFDVGADFSFDVEIGETRESLTKEPSVIGDIAYRDTWGRGSNSYIAMLCERITLIRDLLHPEGTIFLHVGWQVSGMVRLALDEIFGSEHHLNEIVWKRTPHAGSSKARSSKFPVNHETIFWYSKGNNYYFENQYEPYSDEYVRRFSNPGNDSRGPWQSVSLKT
jgi:adenine-specific DNA-methyltransferase